MVKRTRQKAITPKKRYRRKQKKSGSAIYRARIARLMAKGHSRSQARGHARAGEPSVTNKAREKLQDMRLQVGLKSLSKGESLAQAARTSGLSAEWLRRYLTDRELAKKKNGRWVLIQHRLRWRWVIFANGRAQSVDVDDPMTNSVIGRHLNAVRTLLHTNNAKPLRRFRHTVVRDVAGRAYRLETDPNTLYRLDHAERETPEDFYRFAT